ncbi:Uu.00g082110.m01.CDS01 [Anthostomella pinea]|uniref:Uu.00g082110.m01.CDS01 n=1 Tax=Anthostomella pinea TaxID=933095 RepID=A0AAI8VLA6_9PEZI|nr:Uu.00g082110.m01.CDS01 [Anthostomella pinea]
MAVSRVMPAVLGLAALLATAAIFALDVVLAHGLSTSTSPVRIAAAVASALEAIVLAIMIVLLAGCIQGSTYLGARRSSALYFPATLVASLLASTVSVAELVLMGKTANLPETILQVPSTRFLVGASVALGFASAGQLVFIVVMFVLHRLSDPDQALSLHTTEEGHRSSPLQKRVKSIPYSQTRTAVFKPSKSYDGGSAGYPTPPGSSSGRSAAETVSSIRSSLSHAMRPMGSRTGLLSNGARTGRRPPSIDPSLYSQRTNPTEESFDSWDTSSLEPHHRQMVLDSSPQPSRFLETIPASPATSRSPSPGCPLDLEEPKRYRSRSFSPVPRPQVERTLTPQSSTDELHIHPLFRSDSPVPPPASSPGTIVVASPNAGQIIPGKSVKRMRSDSLPASRSPLSRQGSRDSSLTTPRPSEDGHLRIEEVEERKMTPPIPDWILSAGSRTSLTEYQLRKQRDRDATPSDTGSPLG